MRLPGEERGREGGREGGRQPALLLSPASGAAPGTALPPERGGGGGVAWFPLPRPVLPRRSPGELLLPGPERGLRHQLSGRRETPPKVRALPQKHPTSPRSASCGPALSPQPPRRPLSSRRPRNFTGPSAFPPPPHHHNHLPPARPGPAGTEPPAPSLTTASPTAFPPQT